VTRVAVRIWPAAAIATLLCAIPAGVGAHRLDEYLQAIRVAVDRDRIDLEIDLTPGVVLADTIFDSIDTDRSGDVSKSEQLAYANDVLTALIIELDDHRQLPRLSAYHFPTLEEMREGEGTVRLTATAPLASIPAGRHRLRIRNDHRPEVSVYLVNALVPATREIEITSQARDRLQRELRLEYRVVPTTLTSWPAITAGATATMLSLVVWRRREARKKHSEPGCDLRVLAGSRSS
jgi:hypothetical protein